MKREYDLSKGKRGAVMPLPSEKIRITIRLDRDIADQFRDQVRRAHRGNYQTLINEALREHLQRPNLAQEVGKELLGIARRASPGKGDYMTRSSPTSSTFCKFTTRPNLGVWN